MSLALLWLALPLLLIAVTAVNFTNFMDGLDGLVAGCMAVSLAALAIGPLRPGNCGSWWDPARLPALELESCQVVHG